MNKRFRTRFIESLITLFIGLLATVATLVLIFLIRNLFEPQKQAKKQLENIENTTNEIKKVLTPYESKDQLYKVVILQNFTNSIRTNYPTDTFDKRFLVSGLFNQGYLYIKASIDDSNFDNQGTVYTKMYSLSNRIYQEFGGHLITSKSLDTPKTTNSTELLYQLTDIKYKKDFRDSDIEVTSADWLKLLNTVGGHGVLGFVSTMNEGKIIELSIYYGCVTGSECKISLEK